MRGPQADPKCAAPSPPGDGSHVKVNQWDCDVTSATPTSRAAVRLVGDKCMQCSGSKVDGTGTWVEEIPAVSCGTPQLEPLRVREAPSLFDGPESGTWLGFRLFEFLKQEQFDNAQALIDSTARSKQRLTNGRWVGWELVAGYQVELGQERAWDVQLARLKQWRAEDPGSGAAALLEAGYWQAYAWFARGTQSSGKVPEDAFRIAHERMARARAVLEEAKPYAAWNPAWYVESLDVAVFDGAPMAERSALFAEAVRVEPLYDATYQAMAHGLTPRWGGSLEAYHRFVRAAVQTTKSAYGNLLAARLYWSLADTEWDKEPFTALHIPWPAMRSGFEDMMRLYPDSSWNLNHYAYFACRAGDKKTFKAVLGRLDSAGSKRFPWREPYTRDYCETRLGKAKAAR
jgi:hypothetical protein